MNTMVIIAGVPGSGKSTFAKRLYEKYRTTSFIVSNDKIFQMLTGTNDAIDSDTYRFEKTPKIIAAMWVVKKAILRSLLEFDSKNIIVDAVHFQKDQIDFFNSFKNVDVKYIYLNIEKSIALERAQKRARKEDKKTIDFCLSKLKELNYPYDYVLSNDEEINNFIEQF